MRNDVQALLRNIRQPNFPYRVFDLPDRSHGTMPLEWTSQPSQGEPKACSLAAVSSPATRLTDVFARMGASDMPKADAGAGFAASPSSIARRALFSAVPSPDEPEEGFRPLRAVRS
jgi:hypothetical protein